MITFLHAQILHAGEVEPEIKLIFTRVTDTAQERMTLSLTFDRPDILLTYTAFRPPVGTHCVYQRRQHIDKPVCLHMPTSCRHCWCT
jgi:hypothetical protein